MRIGLAQINTTVGDFAGNAGRILEAYREAVGLGAELVLTPEMSLAGYPPLDLVFKSAFVPRCLEALEGLSAEVGEVPLLAGYVDHNEGDGPGKPFRNAAAFVVNGEVAAKVFKTLLPTYDVFDERRYFEPWEHCEVVTWGGRKLGITICEDIWTEEYLYRPLYKRDPVRELRAGGAEILLNLSASPYHSGRPAERRRLLCGVAREAGIPLVLCNAVGGNDQLVFDGHSLGAGADGVPRRQLAGFREEVAVVEPFAGVAVQAEDPPEEEQLFGALVLGLRDYAGKCGFEKACVGLSGGIDSALTATLAAEALGARNVHTLTMPGPYSSAGSVDDSLALAEALGMRCDVAPIETVFEEVKAGLRPVFGAAPEDVTEENMQARIRGLFLMSLSNKFNYLLLSTGNKSELAVGYCTIYGDMCGGLALISDLPKSNVYAVARWINRDREIIPWRTIEKAPSAELRPDQEDQDTLPPYEVLDAVLELYVEQQLSGDDIIETHGFDEGLVRWVQRQVDRNEWKRYQAAPCIRVTSKAFGIGRRYPIVQRFGG